jgi:Multicopper oxidase
MVSSALVWGQRVGRTEKHVYRGLAGLLLVDDQPAAVLDLPRTYGVDDIPVIVQDKRFHDDGSFDESDDRPTGLLGDRLLVNGAVTPHLVVTSRRVRLRLLNASTARIYCFGFADNRSFTLIGTDGGLLARPHETDRIQLSPAERAEIVVAALIRRCPRIARSAVVDGVPTDSRRLSRRPAARACRRRHRPHLLARRAPRQRQDDGHGPDRRRRGRPQHRDPGDHHPGRAATQLP